jgi:hypothetical protein
MIVKAMCARLLRVVVGDAVAAGAAITWEQSIRIFSKEQSLEGDGRIRALKSFSV